MPISKTEINEKAKTLKAKLDEQKGIFDAQDARIEAAEKAKGDVKAAMKLTDDEQTKLKSLDTEINELGNEINQFNEYIDARAANDAQTKNLTRPLGTPEFPGDARNREEIKSMGQRFTESKQWKDFLSQVGGSDGIVSESVQIGRSPIVELSTKALVTGTSLNRDLGSGMTRPDYQGVIPLFLRPLTIRDVVTVGQTGSDMVEYTQITAFDNQAAPTAEPTSVNASGVATGGLYNQSGINTALVKTNVKSIPHYVPISKRALADSPQIETYINNFLLQGAEIKLEDQTIVGNNVGENFQGLDNTPGITLQAYVDDGGVVANSMIKTARQARTKVRYIGRAIPTAYVMNPLDWETFDLSKNLQGNYYFGGPLALGLKTLWGLPVVESEAVLQGTFYVGDMKQAVIWDRERANVFATDSPNDYVLRGLVALVCELRAAFGVLRPSAIVRGDFLAGPNS